MARFSFPSIPAKKSSAHGSKHKHSRIPTEDGPRRKTSMSAYYRPQQRGFINIDLWDMDDIETDVTQHA